MKDLYFDSEKHEYYYKGKKVDCVSDVLKLVDVINLEGIPPRNLQIAAERGTAVHELTEDYDYDLIDLTDEEWIQENEEYYNYLIAYANFVKDQPAKPIVSEEQLYSPTYNLAGTLDLVKYIDGEIAIVDKKTSKTISALRSLLQLNLYRLLWNENHQDMTCRKLYILQLKENGEHRLIPIEINEEKALAYLNIFKEIKGDKKL